MFERPHHRRIASLLHALDADLLTAHGCLFGGGTAIALRFGEFRESVDIDFLVSDADGYRAMRQRLTGPTGIGALCRPGLVIEAARPIRADQYGVRTLLKADGADIKFELVREARIVLQSPGDDDRICGVATLTPLDMATSKLLANADRWDDDAVHSRDLIDLAMMVPTKKLLTKAVAKARTAYGDSVETELRTAVAALGRRRHRLDRCMEALQMSTVPKAVVWKRIKALV